MADEAWCKAVNQAGSPITVCLPVAPYRAIVLGQPAGRFICTQDAGHAGGHSACDGLGHVLARWARRDPERWWHPEDCAGCAHHRAAQRWQ